MKFDTARPIYLQLVEYFRNQILSGVWQEGKRLPSVRDFALQLQVNPNTVQKALSQLETEGLIMTKRNVGKFVTMQASRIDVRKADQAKQLCLGFVKEMTQLGYTEEEMIHLIKETLHDGNTH